MTSPDGPPRVTPRAARPHGHAPFWAAQVGGWTAYALVLYLTYFPSLLPEQRLPLLLNKGLRAPIGLAASLVLHAAFARLRRRGAGPATLAGVALVGSLVLGVAAYGAHRELMMAFGRIPRAPLYDWVLAPRAIVDFAFALVAWSAAYLGVVFWQDAERRERETADARRAAGEAALLAREAQLEALAYQLNPHFLFNALSSIRAMVDEDPARARRMIAELGGFLRYALVERPLQTATLADELAALRDYLAIEQIRFEERLVVDVAVSDDAAACTVPAFLVHPLVENALKHGAPRAPGGPLHVALRARVDARDDRVVVEVWNSGALRPSVRDPGRPGVGVRNVRARLERMFPGRHAFTLEERDGGVLATVAIPRIAAAVGAGSAAVARSA